MPALHIAAAQSPAAVPMVEYLVNLQATQQALFRHLAAPEQGLLSLPGEPGLGLIIDEEKIVEKRELTWQN